MILIGMFDSPFVRRVGASACFLLLTGCAGFGVNEYDLRPDARIGIALLMGDQLTHHHAGITVFNTFDKQYPAAFEYPMWVKSELLAALQEHSRFELVSVDVPPSLRAGREGRAEATADFARETAKAMNLDLVIFITDACSHVLNRTDEMCGYGLLTQRMAYGDLQAHAYANVVFVRITPAGKAWYPGEKLPPRGLFEDPLQLKSDLEPKDVDAVTPEELIAIDGFIREIVKRRIAGFLRLMELKS